MHEVLVNRLGGLSLPRKSVVRLTDRPDMTLDVYRGRKTTIQQQYNIISSYLDSFLHIDEKLLIFHFGAVPSSAPTYVIYVSQLSAMLESVSNVKTLLI